MVRTLIPLQRRRRLVELAGEHGLVAIRTAAEELQVSPMTVRRDIEALAAEGAIEAVRGGFQRVRGHRPPYARREREALHSAAKEAIAAAAARRVRPGSAIFLDAGTTCQAVVPYLASIAELTVVTNDFRTVLELALLSNVRVHHVGGTLDPASAAGYGFLAMRAIAQFEFDLALLSTAAWSLESGVRADELSKAELKNAVLNTALESVLLADSSKYGAKGMVSVCPLSELGGIITDADLAEADLRALTRQGLAVDVVHPRQS